MLFLVISCSASLSNAQTVDSTGNLITNNVDLSGQTGWSGIGGYSQIGGQQPTGLWGCCTSYSGAAPFLDTATYVPENGSSGQIHWSYGQATVGQSVSIPNALGNTGLSVLGYSWGYDVRNMNGGGGQGGTDTLTATTYITNSSGQTILSDTRTYNTQFEWTRFSGTQTLASPTLASGLGRLGVNFTSMDSGFWAGYYGPQVRNVDLRLNYMVDQCALDPLSSSSCPGYAQAFKDQQCTLNPLYDQTCPGYAQAYFFQQCGFNPLYDTACPGNSSVVSSGNLVPNPGGQTGFFGGFLNNSFAINTALSHNGAGLMVHGFQWGYRATNYNFWLLPQGSSTVNVNIRNGDGTSLYAWSRNNTDGGSYNYSSSYILPQSTNNLTMGNFDFTATSSGLGVVDSMWAKALITPDQCTLDPLSSTACTGYQSAFLAQQCSLNTLYSPSCPGYTEALQAMLDEQARLAAASTTTTETTVSTGTADTTTTGSNDGTVLSSSSDTTSSPAAVTTDAGGVDVSTTGEIKAQDGVPEVAKETKTAEKSTDEKVVAETADKKDKEKKTLSTNQLLAIARQASDDRAARAIAEQAEKESQSENANPSDGGTGTDAARLGTGISLPGFSMRFSGTDSTETAESSVLGTTAASMASGPTSLGSTAGADQTNQQQAGGSVKKNVQPNKLAGDETTIAALTQPPADFNSYLTSQLKDAQFYQQREIYKGQRNVDNARLLRGLTGGSDRLHQEMVDQQYGKLGAQ